jgi:hypothetical protein
MKNNLSQKLACLTDGVQSSAFNSSKSFVHCHVIPPFNAKSFFLNELGKTLFPLQYRQRLLVFPVSWESTSPGLIDRREHIVLASPYSLRIT